MGTNLSHMRKKNRLDKYWHLGTAVDMTRTFVFPDSSTIAVFSLFRISIHIQYKNFRHQKQTFCNNEVSSMPFHFRVIPSDEQQRS